MKKEQFLFDWMVCMQIKEYVGFIISEIINKKKDRELYSISKYGILDSCSRDMRINKKLVEIIITMMIWYFDSNWAGV